MKSVNYHITLRYLLGLCIAFASLLFLIGCGGGNGNGNIPLSGSVTLNTPSSPASRTIPTYTVKAFLWPDTNTPIASTQTDASGHFSFSLSQDKSGKDLILIATQSEQRGSHIVADLPESGKNDANITICSSLTAELIGGKAKQLKVMDLTANTVTTIEAEMVKMNGLDTTSLNAGGLTVQANFGDGIVNSSDVMAYANGNKVIQDALAAMTQHGGGISPAKQIVQLLRDTTKTAVANGKNNNASMVQETLRTRTQLRTMAQTYNDLCLHTQTMFRLLARTRLNNDTLENLPPGGYVYQKGENGKWDISTLWHSGNQWMVRVYYNLPVTEDYYTVTITPTNPIPAFAITPAAGEYKGVIADNGVTQATFDLKFNNNTSNQPIQANLDISMTDPDPDTSEPITFSGVMSGTPTDNSGDGKYLYSNVSLSGTLSSKYLQGSLDGFKIYWDNPSDLNADPQRVELTKATLTLQQVMDTQMSMVMENAKMTIAQTLREMECTMTMTTANTRIQLANMKMSLVSIPDTSSGADSVKELPSTISGDMEFSSPTTTFNGNVSMTWDNPTTANSITAETFPIGTVAMKGQLTSTLGAPINIEWNAATTNTNNTPKLTMTIAQLGDGSQNLSGSVIQSFSMVNNTVQPNGPVTMDLTATPSNAQIHITAQQNAFSGTIKQGNNTLANIGTANSLGMPDLGNAAIIKYSDGSFETAASILPGETT